MILFNRFIQSIFLYITLFGLGILASLKLGGEFYRLIWDKTPKGAIDLLQRHLEIIQWFSGKEVYRVISHASYPPASYVMLWPFIGAYQEQVARWIWALVCLFSMFWLVHILIKECQCTSITEKIFIALIPLSLNATGITVGNGQLGIVLLPLIIKSVQILSKERIKGSKLNIALVAFLLFSLIKPNFSAPFFLIVLFVFSRYKLFWGVAISYIGLTIFSSYFQNKSFLILLSDWFETAHKINNTASSNLDYVSIHTLLSKLGSEQFNLMASLVLLLALSIWLYVYKNADIWSLFGVTAIVARTWSYHGIYDDMLLIIPLIAVFKILKKQYENNELENGSILLLSGSIFVMLFPARMYIEWNQPWPFVYAFSHLIFWSWLLIYLVYKVKNTDSNLKSNVIADIDIKNI